jgi:hypothetical protein
LGRSMSALSSVITESIAFAVVAVSSMLTVLQCVSHQLGLGV